MTICRIRMLRVECLKFFSIFSMGFRGGGWYLQGRSACCRRTYCYSRMSPGGSETIHMSYRQDTPDMSSQMGILAADTDAGIV